MLIFFCGYHFALTNIFCSICWVSTLVESFPGITGNRPLFAKGRKRLKKEADQCRLVGGRFNKPGNLYTGLSGVVTR